MKKHDTLFKCRINVPEGIRLHVLREYGRVVPDEIYVEIPSLEEAKKGFWISEKFKHTVFQNCVFWIPPSSVIYVLKEITEYYETE